MKVLPRQDARNPALAERTARALNEYSLWSFHTLSAHPLNIARKSNGSAPVNIVGLQRPGKMIPVPPFEERWGLRPLCIASGAIYHGLCSILGMDILKTVDSDNAGNDLVQRLKLAKEATDHDFIYVHSKAPDEAAHRKDPMLKVKVIEELDRAFSYVLKEIIPEEDILFILTSDHSTASAGNMIHSGETGETK
jgi:2,3-bisphosphoglycerate-independent phosphoglycerate mutase